MLIALWLTFFAPSSHASSICFVPKAVMKGTRLGAGKKEEIDFYPGEELGFLSFNKKQGRATVRLDGDKFRVEYKNFDQERRPACGLKMCVRLKNKAQYYKSPNPYDKAEAIADGIYHVVSKSGGWYRAHTNENYVWFPATQLGDLKTDCDAPVTTEVSEEAERPSMVTTEEDEVNRDIERYRWHFGFEGGYISTTSSKPLESLLTPVPAAGTDVNSDTFDSPFVESVTEGTGWFVGGTLQTSLWSNFRAKYSVGYKQRSIRVVTRPNPHAATPVLYSQLGREEFDETFKFVYLNTVIKYSGFQFWRLQWQPGLNVGVDYALQDFTMEFDTKPNKLTSYSKEAGYDTLTIYGGPRLDISYGAFDLGIAANFNQFGLEPTAILGLNL